MTKTTPTSGSRRTVKAQITRESLIVAAAAILRDQGPQFVTYRRVAQVAGESSSSVGYHFDSSSDLLREAATYNIRLWAQRAENAASYAEVLPEGHVREQVVELLLRACLPEGIVPAAHYAQLISAGQSEVVTESYGTGAFRITKAVGRILKLAEVNIDPRIIVAIVDGAAVQAISEGKLVRENARTLLSEAVEQLS